MKNKMLIDNFEDMELVKMEFRRQLFDLIKGAFMEGYMSKNDSGVLDIVAGLYAKEVVKGHT